MNFFIITATIIYLIVTSWAKFYVKNPIEADLLSLCQSLQKKEQPLSYKTADVKRLSHFLFQLDKESQDELISDFAKSKNLTWNCSHH